MRAPGRRYVLLETLRAFGAEQLAAAGTADARGRAPRPALRRVGRGRRPPAVRARATGAGRDRRRHPRAARRARLAARPRTRSSSPAAWSRRCSTTASCASAPTCWHGRSGCADADPDDRSPLAARVWAVAALRRLDGRRRRRARRRAAPGRSRSPSGPAADVPPEVCMVWANYALFEGRLGEAADLVPAGACRRRRTTRRSGCWRRARELLPLGYAGDPPPTALPPSVLAEVGEARDPVRRVRLVLRRRGGPGRRRRAGRRPLRPGPRAGRRTKRLVRGRHRRRIEGVDRRPRRRPPGRRRRLPAADPPLAPGRDVVDAVDDAALDRRAAGPARALPRRGRPARCGARRPAPGTASSAPTRSRSTELGARLRAALGDDAYEAARRRGRRARRRRRRRARPRARCDASVTSGRVRRPGRCGRGDVPARLAPIGCMNPPARTSRQALASGWRRQVAGAAAQRQGPVDDPHRGRR